MLPSLIRKPLWPVIAVSLLFAAMAPVATAEDVPKGDVVSFKVKLNDE